MTSSEITPTLSHELTFHHGILAARDRQESAAFLAWPLGRPDLSTWGPFTVVELDGGVRLDFTEPPCRTSSRGHYTFLVYPAGHGLEVLTHVDP